MKVKWLVACLLLCLVTKPCSGQDDCDFQFRHQPIAELSCNPWPYIHTNDTLTLQCSISGPQTQDIPHAMWYMSSLESTTVVMRILFEDTKYSDPTDNAHVSDGRKMVDLMLVIANVSEEDAGCYWCEINVESSRCTFPLMRSSAFCLHKREYYAQMDNCTDIPTNTTEVCAGNESDCGGGDVPSNGPDEPSDVPMPTQTSEVTNTKNGPTPPLSNHQQSSPQLHPSAKSEPTDGSAANGMAFGMYTGLTVCLLLLIIIAVLVSILICMLKKRRTRQPHRAPIHPNSWAGNDAISHGTASVTSSNVNLLQTGTTPPPTPIRTDSLRTELRTPLSPPVQRYKFTNRKLSFLGSRKEKAEGEGHCRRGEQRDTKSPEFHYYYVLEKPQYYNVPVVGMERVGSSGDEEDWEEVVLKSPPCPKPRPPAAVRREPTNDPEYDLPSPGYSPQARAMQFGERREESKKPHVYKRLEESTMEPKSEYTKLVTSSQ